MTQVKLPAEFVFSKTVARGERGKNAKAAQEWLCLHGFHVAVDGIFGPATAGAVAEYQEQMGLPASGKVTRATFDALTAPVRAALAPLPVVPDDLGETVVAIAKQHLAQHPREIGGENSGPWVRLYMNGKDGRDWLWCAGFVCLLVKQAAAEMERAMPFPRSVSCDVLAMQARHRGAFVKEADVRSAAERKKLAPGTIFLSRKTANDWVHTGIVVEASADRFTTIEGNTNSGGGRNGYEVCLQRRGYEKKDFIRIS
ncbi:MAG: peptidoglycan-binding domain-containing protein [Alphaproteobacteria bacterium]